MRYLEAGTGPALILVHGIAAYSFSFRWNIETLAKHFHVIAPDFLFLGFSDCPAGLDPTLPATSDRLREFMDQLGLAQAHFVASSHGGSVLMQMAAKNPERVASMILVSPCHPLSQWFRTTVTRWLTPLGLAIAALIRYCPDSMHGYVIGRMYGDKSRLGPDVGPGYGPCLRRKETVAFVISAMRTLIAETDALKPQLAKLQRIPTLLLWGDRDPVIEPASALELQKHIPGSQLAMIPGAGHLVYEELPEDFNRLALQFFAAQARTAAGLQPAEQEHMR